MTLVRSGFRTGTERPPVIDAFVAIPNAETMAPLGGPDPVVPLRLRGGMDALGITAAVSFPIPRRSHSWVERGQLWRSSMSEPVAAPVWWSVDHDHHKVLTSRPDGEVGGSVGPVASFDPVTHGAGAAASTNDGARTTKAVMLPFDRLGDIVTTAHRDPDLRVFLHVSGIKLASCMTTMLDPLRALPRILALSSEPTIGVVLSGAVALSRSGPPFADVAPFVYEVVDAFGPDRVAWGSDALRLPPGITYADSLNVIAQSSDYTTAEKRWILGATASRFLGQPLYP